MGQWCINFEFGFELILVAVEMRAAMRCLIMQPHSFLPFVFKKPSGFRLDLLIPSHNLEMNLKSGSALRPHQLGLTQTL